MQSWSLTSSCGSHLNCYLNSTRSGESKSISVIYCMISTSGLIHNAHSQSCMRKWVRAKGKHAGLLSLSESVWKLKFRRWAEIKKVCRNQILAVATRRCTACHYCLDGPIKITLSLLVRNLMLALQGHKNWWGVRFVISLSEFTQCKLKLCTRCLLL